LTPTELRVAQLAAAGSQNKEIAGALFISVKSVEANLWRVYAKLGVRSRTELGSQLPKIEKTNSAGYSPSTEEARWGSVTSSELRL
jgi:FixJ family two-component response regulator